MNDIERYETGVNFGFLIETTEVGEGAVTFVVRDIQSTDVDGGNPEAPEQYLKAQIKFDGCAHVWFGEEQHKGYLHLCGARDMAAHALLMHRLYEKAGDLLGYAFFDDWPLATGAKS